MKQLVIIGASGHGKVVADIAKKNGYDPIIFLDDSKTVEDCAGYAVAGKCCSFTDYGCDIIVAIGNPVVRGEFLKELEKSGKNIPVLIHPGAIVADNAAIGKGTVIAAGAVVNPCAVIGKGCIINTCASVDHDCVVADYVHVSVGAHVAGTVSIGERTWIGAGATVSNNVSICGDAMIGAGAVVVKDICEKGTYVGVPARKIK